VANYKVDIGVKVRGDELKKFQTQLDETQKKVNGVNRFLDTFKKQNIRVNESISNLNAQLIQAKTTFNDATLGTNKATQATKDYLTALTNTNAALAKQKAAVISLQNAKRSDAFFLAQGAIAGKQNRLDEAASQAQSVAIARANNIRIQAELANQELLKEVQTRAPRLPAFQERGLERLEDEFKQKKELKILEENANKESKKRLNFQERQNQELDRQKKLGIGVNKNEKLINASYKDRVKFAERNGKIRRQALVRANNLLLAEKKITEQRAKQNQAGFRGRSRANAASSAIIGGAFPLLFGQTGAAAVGGGVGGALGGAMGGQFGFALSILGTAIGSAIDKSDKFNQSLARLNSTLRTSQDGFQTTARDVGNLAKQLGITKEEAINVLNSFAAFDSAGVRKSLALAFGDAGTFNAVAAAQTEAALAQQIFQLRDKIGNTKASELLNQLKITGSMEVELALALAIADANERAQIAAAEQVRITDRLLLNAPSNILNRLLGDDYLEKRGELRGQKLQKKFDEDRKTRIEDIKKGFEETRQLIEQLDFFTGKFGQTTNDVFSSLDEELKKLQSPMYQLMTLSQTMAQSFETSFKGIIKGTMSISDAFRNMFSRIADHYLDMAARMLAIQFQKGFMGMFGSIFSGFGGGLASSAQLGAQATAMTGIPSGADLLPGSFGISGRLANGGYAQRGKSYLVGERGAEIFTPGASGGQVSPMGSTNIVVNVDASGSSVEGDEEQGRELGRMISVAIQSELIKQKRPGGMLA
jgi:hypothetical protein